MNTFQLPDRILNFSNSISEAGGTAYVAGGCVRDHLLGIESKDIDLEIHNLAPERLVEIIKRFKPYKAVGKSFGVWKLLPVTQTDLEVDVALPQQNGQPAPFIGTQAACTRRDLTINSMLWNIEAQELEDPFHGSDDLQNRLLKATHDEHFAEDPLRVFRVAQFAGRLQCDVDPNLQTLCQTLTAQSSFATLPKERVLIELEKGWFKSLHPEVATKWMVVLRALPEYIPIFKTLSVEQWQRTFNRIKYAGSKRSTLSKGHSMGLFWAMLTSEFTDSERTLIFDHLNIERFHGFPIRRAFDQIHSLVSQIAEQSSRIVQNHIGEHIRPTFVYDVADGVLLGQSQYVRENRQQSAERGILHTGLPRLLSGEDLLQLGLKGAELGKWMQQIRKEQLDERIQSRASALNWIKENL